MNLFHRDPKSNGEILLISGESTFQRVFFGPDRAKKYLTIAWNRGPDQTITVDNQKYLFRANHFISFVVNHTFSFENATAISAWQFNRDFYCIIHHDAEVSCVGLLFYGSKDLAFIRLPEKERDSMETLLKVFTDEFQTEDNLQSEMLRMLLKRLIVKLTRLYKDQNEIGKLRPADLDVVRQFNLLVENHYQALHQVQDYADLVHKSPKTLSNLFKLYNDKSPLQVIHERILLEAKRMLLYTDLSAKEIANEIGFKEFPHFSRFFKKMMQMTPHEYRLAAKRP